MVLDTQKQILTSFGFVSFARGGSTAITEVAGRKIMRAGGGLRGCGCGFRGWRGVRDGEQSGRYNIWRVSRDEWAECGECVGAGGFVLIMWGRVASVWGGMGRAWFIDLWLLTY